MKHESLSKKIRIVMLGSGTSFGVPIPGCDCKTCTSTNPKNKRTRTSLYINDSATSILIDTSKDLWNQFLDNHITDVDHVLYTHHHADHILGLDDLRFVNIRWKKPINIWGRYETIQQIKKMFSYIFEEQNNYVSKPKIISHLFQDEIKEFGNISIEAISVDHHCMDINGYIINQKLAYLTDIKSLHEESLEKVKHMDYLILGCIRYKPHPNHMNYDEAIEFSETVKARHTILTHTAHYFDYETLNHQLPDNIRMGYDGFSFEI